MKSSPRRRGPDPGQVIEEVVVSTSEAAAAVGKEMRLKRKRKLPEESEEAVLEEVQDQVVIQSAEGRSQVVIRGTDGSMIIQDIGEEEALTTTTGAAGESQQYVIQTEEGEVISGEEVVTEYHDNIAEEEEDEEADEEGRVANHRYKIGKGEVNSEEDGENNSDMVLTMVPKTVCHAYVIAKTVKEFRDLGRDMLRIHAENHGIEHASKLRMSELVREMIQHYNGVHNAGMEVSKLDQLKLNMLTLKKVKVDLREKTPPPDITKLIPKNVVPIEEQVHHVYEKRPDICTVEIIVNNLKDMLALGTSILRPEASKHRVCNSSRKQKLQVVEELWEHYLKFHLKDTEQGGMIVSNGMVKELVGDEYVEYRYQDQEDGGQVILVSEGDLVAGEDIHTAAEEVTA